MRLQGKSQVVLGVVVHLPLLTLLGGAKKAVMLAMPQHLQSQSVLSILPPPANQPEPSTSSQHVLRGVCSSHLGTLSESVYWNNKAQ